MLTDKETLGDYEIRVRLEIIDYKNMETFGMTFYIPNEKVKGQTLRDVGEALQRQIYEALRQTAAEVKK